MIEAIIKAGGEPDDVLRGVVAALVDSGSATWAAIRFAESGELVPGPEAGAPTGESRTDVPVVYAGARVAELSAENADPALLERIAPLIAEHCLVAWDTGGDPWEP